MTSREVIKLRQTAAFTGLGKKLFSRDALNLSPTAVTSLLRAAGIPVSKNAQITADTAQIIVSGGTFISDISKGAKLAQLADPTVTVMAAAFDIMQQLGWVDKDDPICHAITLGFDLTLVISSAGSNVMADIKLAVDLICEFSNRPDNQLKSEIGAYKALSEYLNRRRKMQVDALAQNFKDFHEGKVSVFGLMGKMAEESPDVFYNYFPDAQTFIPPAVITVTQCFTSYSNTLFRGHEDYRTCIESDPIVTVLQNDHSFIQSAIFQNYVAGPIEPFKRLDDTNKSLGKVSVKTLALLSMLPPYIDTYPMKGNILKSLEALKLTPADFGENAIDNELLNQISVPEAPITFNGVDIWNKDSIDKTKINNDHKQAFSNNQTGNIAGLLNTDIGKKVLPNWGQPEWSGAATLKTLSGNKYFQKLTNAEMMTHQQRMIRNYWSVLSIISKMKQDQYFGDFLNSIGRYDYIGTLNEYEKSYKDLQFKSIARHLNAKAKTNLFKFFGTDKIKRLNPGSIGKPAVYDYM